MKLPTWLNHTEHIPHSDMVCPGCNLRGTITWLMGFGHVCQGCGYKPPRNQDGKEKLRDILQASKLRLLKDGATLDDAKKILAAAGVLAKGVTLEAAVD